MILRPPLQSQLNLLGCGSSGGGLSLPANSAEAQAYFDLMVPPPTAGSLREAAMAALIDGLYAAGMDDSLEFLCCFRNDTKHNAFLNLFAASNSYACQEYQSTSGLAFTADVGFSGGVLGHHIRSNYNPSTASSPKWTLNDASAVVLISDNTAVGDYSMWASTTAAPTTRLNTMFTFWPKWGNSGGVLNGTAEAGVANAGNTQGLWILQRTDSSTVTNRRDNSSLGNLGSATSVAVPTGEIVCQAPHQHAFFGAGGSLDNTKRAALQTLLDTYQAATLE